MKKDFSNIQVSVPQLLNAVYISKDLYLYLRHTKDIPFAIRARLINQYRRDNRRAM